MKLRGPMLERDNNDWVHTGMKIFPTKKLFTLFCCLINLPTFGSGSAEQHELKSMTAASVVLHDEIIIDRSVEKIWSELLVYPLWYFAGEKIERVAGKPGQLGYTLAVNDHLLHTIVSVRPFQSVVWKTCIIVSCVKNYNFSDLKVRELDGKTLFARSLYSQEGFWPKAVINDIHRAQAQGKVPEIIRKISLEFKTYVEAAHE